MRAALLLVAALAGCSSKGLPPPPPPPPAAAAAPVSRAPLGAIDTADPAIASQLVSGFHPVESWGGRWTKQSFTVQLKAPAGARERGATLRVKADTPPGEIAQLKAVTFDCTVAGKPLPPETWSAAGSHVYQRPVPAVEGELLPVTCKVERKFVAPGDSRELGVVLRGIGLEPN